MHLLYIDESDTSDTGGKVIPRWYCLTGVRIVDSSHGKTTEEFVKMLKINKISNDFELKGQQLFNGRGFWGGKAIQERIAFSQQVCNFIKSSNLTLYPVLEIVKNNDHVSTYKKLLNAILGMASKHVSNAPITGRQLILIYDKRPDIEKKIFEQIKISRTELIKNYERKCRFIDYGYDGDSKLCWGIQIADFVSYFLRKQKTFKRISDSHGNADNPERIKWVDDIINDISGKCKLKCFS